MKKILAVLLSVASLTAASPASALLCQSSNPLSIQKIYSVWDKSGGQATIDYEMISYQKLPGVSIGRGKVGGLNVYIACLYEGKNRCAIKMPNAYSEVNVTYFTNETEMAQYGHQPINALKECFNRLGAGGF